MRSQCILAIRRPGNVNSAPSKAPHNARDNFMINFDAGPLKLKILTNLLKRSCDK